MGRARASFGFLLAVATLLLAPALAAQSLSPLAGKLYGSGNRNLVILLHGDVSSGGAADYLYPLAASVASAKTGTIAAAVLRPGYFDASGQKSTGSNNGRSDHYTSRNNALVADTILNLKKQIKPSRVIVIGHSGGSAQLGVIIGRYPGLIDTAILASCPCDIKTWRASRNASAWPASQSPVDFVNKVGKGTRIIAVNGSSDSNTRPALAKAYVELARTAGLDASYIEIPSTAHNLTSGYSEKLRQIAIRELK